MKQATACEATAVSTSVGERLWTWLPRAFTAGVVSALANCSPSVLPATSLVDGVTLSSGTAPLDGSAQLNGSALPNAAVHGSDSGSLEVLTYNVAGLPAFISPAKPNVNTRRASPLFNRYDIVLAQEDFSYHEDLVHAAQHPFQLAPEHLGNGLVGDGLTTLSNFPVARQARRSWETCSGYLLDLNDCLGDKGFSVASIYLTDSTRLHVYNLHADAGSAEQDVMARAQGFAQLADFIQRFSTGMALIVGGDTNLDPSDPRDQAILEDFLRRTGLVDACLALGCAERQIDRIFFRSGRDVLLTAEAWRLDETFTDDAGAALSDHPAVAARFSWRVDTKEVPTLASLETSPPGGASQAER